MNSPGGEPPCNEATVTVQPGGVVALVDPLTGFYGPLAIPEGVFTVTAAADGFQPVQVTGVHIVNGTITTQDFDLEAPVIEIDPTHFLGQAAPVGEMITTTLTISNTGRVALEWEIWELSEGVPADLPWVHTDPISGTIAATIRPRC